MKNAFKFIVVAVLTSIGFLNVNAQESSNVSSGENAAPTAVSKNVSKAKQSSDDDYFKTEISGGYSLMKPNKGTISISKESNLSGYEVSITRNFKRFVGVKFSTGGNFYSETETFGSRNEIDRDSYYTFLGGVQFKDNRKATRVKPFGHVMIGAMRGREKFTSTTSNTSTEASTTFAAAFGGGLDIRVNKTFSVRPAQLDLIVTGDGSFIPRSFVRFGAGVVFHF